MTPKRGKGGRTRRQVLLSLSTDVVLDIDAALAVPTSYGGTRSAIVELALREHLRARMEQEPLFRQAFIEERRKLASEDGPNADRHLRVVEQKKADK